MRAAAGWLLLALCASSIPSLAASAAALPSCELLQAGMQRKFHPGHYVAIGRADAGKGLRAVIGDGVAGVQIRYRWAELERAEDVYDFSLIQRDLTAAARHGVQLVVFFEDKSFDGEIPTPAYLRNKYTLPNRNGGYTALRWDPYVVARQNRLVAKLGAEFDCQPNFEGIAFQESAPSLEDKVLDANGYSAAAYRDALIAILRSASESMPRSRVFWYMNFLPRGQKYLAGIATAMEGSGVVMGGPDILPDNPSLVAEVYPLYGQFKGRLPLFNSMQHDSYRHRRTGSGRKDPRYWTMEELFVFARDELHVDYVFWNYRTHRQPADSYAWTDARPVIARNAGFAESRQPPKATGRD